MTREEREVSYNDSLIIIFLHQKLSLDFRDNRRHRNRESLNILPISKRFRLQANRDTLTLAPQELEEK
jgi:hypothetical protein